MGFKVLSVTPIWKTGFSITQKTKVENRRFNAFGFSCGRIEMKFVEHKQLN